MLQFDVLVIGSGGKGMRAALEAGRQGTVSVAMISKMFPTRSATGCAQGDINGALRNADATDSTEKHFFDTVKGSDFLGDQDAIEYFVQAMPGCIKELDYFGVPFSRDPNQEISQRNFGGQSSPRTCYSADKTGHVILHTLYEQCLKHGVVIFSEWQLLDLVVENYEVCGIIALEIKTGRIVPIAAKAVVSANRLGGNSLADIIAFGKFSGKGAEIEIAQKTIDELMAAYENFSVEQARVCCEVPIWTGDKNTGLLAKFLFEFKRSPVF